MNRFLRLRTFHDWFGNCSYLNIRLQDRSSSFWAFNTPCCRKRQESGQPRPPRDSRETIRWRDVEREPELPKGVPTRDVNLALFVDSDYNSCRRTLIRFHTAVATLD